MADGSSIEWTEATWNPTTGCDRVSAGCDNCYALGLAKRLKAMGAPKYQADGDPRTSGPGFGVTLHRGTLGIPGGWARPRLIFVNSMSDLFHARVPIGYVRDVFDVMAAEPRHRFQVLTKRSLRLARVAESLTWPVNVWMGVSVEGQQQAVRLDHLRGVPAAVRFVSLEPLVAPVPRLDVSGVDWAILGGESGPRSRPLQPEWARSVRDACVGAGVPFFFKQWGGRTPKTGGRLLDGREWSEMPSAERDGGAERRDRDAGRA